MDAFWLLVTTVHVPGTARPEGNVANMKSQQKLLLRHFDIHVLMTKMRYHKMAHQLILNQESGPEHYIHQQHNGDGYVGAQANPINCDYIPPPY